jgi:hypothetical protein
MNGGLEELQEDLNGFLFLAWYQATARISLFTDCFFGDGSVYQRDHGRFV